MATSVAPGLPAPNANAVETIPLTEEELEHNLIVSRLIDQNESLVREVEEDLKVRQFKGVSNSTKVYGDKAASRTDINTYAQNLKRRGEIISKLMIGEAPAKKKLSGFALPSFFLPEVAPMVNLQPGTVLWPSVTSDATFSGGLLTSWAGHYIFINQLSIPGETDYFACDAFMKQFLSRYQGMVVDPKKPPVDLDHLNFPTFQQVATHFIRHRDVTANPPIPGPNMDRNTPDGKQRAEAFDALNDQYKALRLVKEGVKNAQKAIDSARLDLQKSQEHLDRQLIPEKLHAKYVHLEQVAIQNYNTLYNDYVQQAAAMGIVSRRTQ